MKDGIGVGLPEEMTTDVDGPRRRDNGMKSVFSLTKMILLML